MNQEKFVEIIKKVVEKSAIEATIRNLESPAGHQPDSELVNLSNWYNLLDIDDKERVSKIIELVAKHSVFGFFSVLDGVRSIRENNEIDEAELNLTYSDSKGKIVLNNPEEDFLHDIYWSLDD